MLHNLYHKQDGISNDWACELGRNVDILSARDTTRPGP